MSAFSGGMHDNDGNKTPRQCTQGPTVRGCLEVDCVSSHYDVHIYMRTGGQTVTTPCTVAVTVNSRWPSWVTVVTRRIVMNPRKVCTVDPNVLLVLSCIMCCDFEVWFPLFRPWISRFVDFCWWVLSPLRPPGPIHSPQTTVKKTINSTCVHTTCCVVVIVWDSVTLSCYSVIPGSYFVERYCVSLKNSRSLLAYLSLYRSTGV